MSKATNKKARDKVVAMSLNEKINELLRLQREEQERIAFSQKVGKIGTFDWDFVTKKSSWTREFEALYGYPEGGLDVIGLEKWMEFIHPLDKKSTMAQYAKALKKGSELHLEFRVIWPNKSVHYLMTRAKISRNKKGSPTHMSGVNIDITNQKNIEKNLEYLASVNRILASSIDYNKTLRSVATLAVPEIADWCSVSLLTEDNQIEQLAVAHVDPKKVKWAEALNKKNPPKINDKGGVAQVIRSGAPVFIPTVTQKLIDASKPDEEQLKLLKKLNLVSIMMVPLGVNGKTIGAISFITTGESGRSYTNADLITAKKVATRAALAIHNAQLYLESQKAISIRDEFISVASHELKTPITSLKMYTQIALKQIKDSTPDHISLDPLRKMNTQLEKLTALINDMLNISRVQIGKLEFVDAAFDVEKLAKDTAESLRSVSQNHAIHIEGSIKQAVWGDKSRIAQVLTNLLVNAIKYSPRATKVKVILKDEKDKARITVQDYGIGIDKQNQKEIFNRFYRVSGREERTFPGMGIGLYISSEIVKRYGNPINVTSTKGKGSQFSFTLQYATNNKKKPGRSQK